MRTSGILKPTTGVLATILLIGLTRPIAGVESTSGDGTEQWFERDDDTPVLESSAGELRFLEKPAERRSPHSSNTLTVTEDSLKDGWVNVVQCHDNLDPFPKAEIVYRYRHMRNLRIQSSSGIERAWVEGQAIQLLNVRPGAKLCMMAEAAILRRNRDGSFTLRNGPFHRKFLDGYYPLHVSLEVKFPGEQLRFEGITPPAQQGFRVTHSTSTVQVDTWFVGKLTVEIRFRRKASSDH